MSFPNYPDKHSLPAVLSAEDIVAYRRRLGRMPKLKTVRGVLFCLERGLPRRMRWRVPVRQAGSMNADIHEVVLAKQPVAILTNFGGGSPMVVELAEEFAVMGARKMVLLTWGGALQPGLKPGDIVVCSQAVRDDGASQHYLPAEQYIQADADLVQNLADAIRARGAACSVGATWTTDAPYRETAAEIRHYQAEGVMVVEMESAGLFTIGRVRGIPAASVVVVMDDLSGLAWEAPERLDPILKSLDLVYAACIDVLAAE